jgi:predicted MFS family arabinose efflux permease
MLSAGREGIRYLLGHRVLRPLAVTSAAYAFFQGMRAAIIVLFLTGPLGLEPLTLGILWGVGGAGALLGALSAARLARAMGTGRAILAAYLVGPFSALAPLAPFFPAVAVPIIFVGQFGMGFWGPIYGVNVTALTQSVVDDRLLGRVLAANRFVYRSPAPLGALAGGLLGATIGLQAALLIAAVGISAGVLWLYGSPVRSMR